MTFAPTVRFRKLHNAAILPEYKTSGAAGMDLHWDGRLPNYKAPAQLPDGLWPEWNLYIDRPVQLFGTGLCAEIPEGYEAQIRPRSSFSKHGIHCFLGTIDSDYRGEILVALLALRKTSKLRRGDRIAQLVVAPVSRCQIVEASELSETARGSGAFGSTGK